jgi:hypothetical protein
MSHTAAVFSHSHPHLQLYINKKSKENIYATAQPLCLSLKKSLLYGRIRAGAAPNNFTRSRNFIKRIRLSNMLLNISVLEPYHFTVLAGNRNRKFLLNFVLKYTRISWEQMSQQITINPQNVGHPDLFAGSMQAGSGPTYDAASFWWIRSRNAMQLRRHGARP